MDIIQLKNISKTYGKGENTTKALREINLTIKKGEFISIMGPSGSGKSTLLNIMGCMDVPTEGDYILENDKISGNVNKELSFIRNKKLSFIFQNFALLNDYTVYENIELPLNCRKISKKEKKETINYFMSRLGIQTLAKKYPSQISGGQQQRVAIARALVTRPEVILADEPTGALDQNTGKELLKLICELHKEGTTIIMVTHDQKVADYAQRMIVIEDGRIKL
ncbi:MAG: ABC transporter ATP-binding protein [bacterium]|nr:ABC transporter ATP-binding protein [bacterium]